MILQTVFNDNAPDCIPNDTPGISGDIQDDDNSINDYDNNDDNHANDHNDNSDDDNDDKTMDMQITQLTCAGGF